MSKNKIYTILSLSITAIFVAIGFYFLKNHEKEYNEAASYQLSKVDELLQQKKLSRSPKPSAVCGNPL